MEAKKKSRNKSRAKKHASIENMSFLGIVTRMAPLGLHFYANDFLVSAKSLPKAESPFSPSFYYLVLHSIELSLKAFLSCRGYSLERLSGGPLGHDLVSLLDECDKKGLVKVEGLKQKHMNEIRTASKYYVEKVFEYPALGEALTGYPGTPDLVSLTEAADLLVRFNKEPCLAAK